MSDIISVLTYKSVETILADGGTQSWALDRMRAARCDYVVICRNANNPAVEGPEEHGSAFLVGKVKDVVPAVDEGRWKILISEYARVDWKEEWSGRNPVAYWKDTDYTDDDGQVRDFKALSFQPLEKLTVPERQGLTIADAKAGLAATFAVPLESIEITIRA